MIVVASNHELTMADEVLHIARPVDHLALRQEVKSVLDDARARIRRHTGLYPDEDLIEEVLRSCDKVAARIEPNPRVEAARITVEERCRQLATAADRFAERDLAAIAAFRGMAVAAVDMFQDVVVDLRRTAARTERYGSLLKRPAR